MIGIIENTLIDLAGEHINIVIPNSKYSNKPYLGKSYFHTSCIHSSKK